MTGSEDKICVWMNSTIIKTIYASPLKYYWVGAP